MAAERPIDLRGPSAIVFDPEYLETPRLDRAMAKLGRDIQKRWMAASRGELVNRESGGYIAGLREDGSISVDAESVIVQNLATYAPAIENGFSSYNLASKVDWSKATKSVGGQPAILVPFAYNAPSSKSASKKRLPKPVHRVGKVVEGRERFVEKLRPGVHVLSGYRHDPTKRDGTPGTKRAQIGVTRKGNQVLAFHQPKDLAQFGRLPDLQQRYYHRTFRGGFKRKGEPGEVPDEWKPYVGKIMGIRALFPTSSWIIPGRPGLFVARKIQAEFNKIAEDRLREAFEADIAAALKKDFVVSLTTGGAPYEAVPTSDFLARRLRRHKTKLRKERRAAAAQGDTFADATHRKAADLMTNYGKKPNDFSTSLGERTGTKVEDAAKTDPPY